MYGCFYFIADAIGGHDGTRGIQACERVDIAPSCRAPAAELVATAASPELTAVASSPISPEANTGAAAAAGATSALLKPAPAAAFQPAPALQATLATLAIEKPAVPGKPTRRIRVTGASFAHPGSKISGASYNGVYQRDGDHNGRPLYRRVPVAGSTEEGAVIAAMFFERCWKMYHDSRFLGGYFFAVKSAKGPTPPMGPWTDQGFHWAATTIVCPSIRPELDTDPVFVDAADTAPAVNTFVAPSQNHDMIARITDGSKKIKARYWVRGAGIDQHTDPNKVIFRFRRTKNESPVSKSDPKFSSASQLVKEAGVYWVHSSDWDRGNSQYRVAAFLGDEHLHTWVAV